METHTTPIAQRRNKVPGSANSSKATVERKLDELVGEVQSIKAGLGEVKTLPAPAGSPLRNSRWVSSMEGSVGYVQPPRVVELVVTKTPKKDCECETEKVEECVDIGVGTEEQMDHKKKKKKREERQHDVDEEGEPYEAPIPLPPPRNLTADDIDHTVTVHIKPSPDGLLGLELREADMSLIGVSPFVARQPCKVETLVGWTLTQVNGNPVSSVEEVPPLVVPNQTTTAKFQLNDLEFVPPEHDRQQCCTVM